MKIRKMMFFVLAVMLVKSAFAITPALAHSFKVMLVLPAPTAAASQARPLREGFMLATTQRDSHPDQESDGHLGGLDVYVNVVEEHKIVPSDFERSVTQSDIVVVFGSAKTQSLVKEFVREMRPILLVPGQSAFSNPALPGVAAFITAFEAAYGETPSQPAAQGYNAARRIDLAVRAQGGVEDIAALRRSFAQTMRDFTW